MTRYKVGYLVGSLATASINHKLALALVRLAPPELELAEISFRELPLYSYDYDADYPPVARAFKNAITASDAIIFVSPEYNRSIPGTLWRCHVGRKPTWRKRREAGPPTWPRQLRDQRS
jgi:chromate reductase